MKLKASSGNPHISLMTSVLSMTASIKAPNKTVINIGVCSMTRPNYRRSAYVLILGPLTLNVKSDGRSHEDQHEHVKLFYDKKQGGKLSKVK